MLKNPEDIFFQKSLKWFLFSSSWFPTIFGWFMSPAKCQKKKMSHSVEHSILRGGKGGGALLLVLWLLLLVANDLERQTVLRSSAWLSGFTSPWKMPVKDTDDWRKRGDMFRHARRQADRHYPLLGGGGACWSWVRKKCPRMAVFRPFGAFARRLCRRPGTFPYFPLPPAKEGWIWVHWNPCPWALGRGIAVLDC